MNLQAIVRYVTLQYAFFPPLVKSSSIAVVRIFCVRIIMIEKNILIPALSSSIISDEGNFILIICIICFAIQIDGSRYAVAQLM